jgi:hypothetical protein
MGKTFRAPIIVEATPLDFKSDIELAELVGAARTQFLNMQNSWWQFAKIIHRIKKTEAFKHVADTFKDYASKDFPSMSYETLTKFCHIVENFEEVIDHRLEKNPDYNLPAYESCYRLTTLKEEVVPKEEIAKLKKNVLDGKMTYASLKDRIKEVMARVRDNNGRDVEDRADRVDQELLKDLKDESFYEDDEEEMELVVDDKEEVEIEEIDDEEEISAVSNKNLRTVIAAMNVRTAYLKDNLPLITAGLNKIKITEELVEFANELVELTELIEPFATKLEELSND